MIEQWRPLAGKEDRYMISDSGNIKRLSYSYTTTFRGKIINRLLPESICKFSKLSQKGYKRINIENRTYFAHILVALTFIPNPNDYPQVNHVNGLKTDNRIENLEWCTNQMNRDHAVKSGLIARGEDFNRKLKESDIRTIRFMIEKGHTYIAIGKIFDVKQQTISKIANKITWAHLP